MQQLPVEIVGTPVRRECDGLTDDLLTAGLGIAGLRGPPPGFADPPRPTTTELRRRAIYMAWRGLADVSDAGGFGRLYGPVGDPRIAGSEWLYALRTPEGEGTHGVVLQVPRGFDYARPKLLAVAAPGSRSTYAALPTAGEWGLRHGFAVVCSDKGLGIGAWDVDRARGWRYDGTLTEDPADPLLSFPPPVPEGLAQVREDAPHSLLFKHAHSGLNPEADWGLYLLQAIASACELLSAEPGPRTRKRITPASALVLAAGVSNGGAAVLRALEADDAGWIDGALAAEPNAIVHGRSDGLAIVSGAQRFADPGIALYDYTSLHALYQPAAILAESDPRAPFAAQTALLRPRYEQWCRDLQALDLLPPGEIAVAAAVARQKLLDASLLPEGLRLGHLNVAAMLWTAITTTYASAYARLPYWSPPFGVRFAAADASGRPRALTDEEAARLWCDGSGVPPTGGVTLVGRGVDGERRAVAEGSIALAVSYAPDRLLTPRARAVADPDRAELHERVREGQEEIVMSAQIGNRPVVIVHGRADSLIPVNHTSRPYVALNARLRGDRDELRYYELQHGQHFDVFLPLPGCDEAYVPMLAWVARGLDALAERIANGTPLPPSQVLRSRPRGVVDGRVPPLEASHLGELRAAPGADAITFDGTTLYVPE